MINNVLKLGTRMIHITLGGPQLEARAALRSLRLQALGGLHRAPQRRPPWLLITSAAAVRP